ncbi:RING-type E3 ubiquitin transferase [Gracilaria domingensis]|nr:RING-type E3 ubiquitin transferase [Gracilaria domingensis]
MLLLALAQEEAERRRRKKKKVALRRWEIDQAAPEALVYRVAAQPAQHKLTLQSHPEQYADAIISLRSAGHLPPEATQQPSSAQPPVSEPPPTSNDTTTTSAQLPQVLVALPPTETNCVICLESIIVGQRVRTLPCNHIYHSQCIRVWLRRKNACPCCCNRVLARRRKRSNNQTSTAVVSDRPVTLEPTYPQRRDDRGENTTLQNTLSRDKSSFLSRQSDDMSLDRFNSDTTSQLDEHNTAELLSQVRSALRGQSSMLSIGTTCSASPSDIVPAPLLASTPLSNELSCPEDEQRRSSSLAGERTELHSTPPVSHHPATEACERQADVDKDGIAPSPRANVGTMSTSGFGSS